MRLSFPDPHLDHERCISGAAESGNEERVYAAGSCVPAVIRPLGLEENSSQIDSITHQQQNTPPSFDEASTRRVSAHQGHESKH